MKALILFSEAVNKVGLVPKSKAISSTLKKQLYMDAINTCKSEQQKVAKLQEQL